MTSRLEASDSMRRFDTYHYISLSTSSSWGYLEVALMHNAERARVSSGVTASALPLPVVFDVLGGSHKVITELLLDEVLHVRVR